jgi:CRP-like cAMP-binding protein
MLESPRLLEGLPDEVARPLLEIARKREVGKSDLLYAFDEYPCFVSYVAMGWFKLATFTPEGEERVLTVKRGGEFLALEAVADVDFVAPEVIALTHASVLTWEVGELRERFHTTPGFTIAVGRVLARSAQRDLRSRVISDSSRVAARLARILFQLAKEQGKPVKDGLRLQLPLTQEELAELITVRRETVSLNFGELEREGVIRRDGRTVVVLVDAMDAYLERLGMGLDDKRRR